MSAETNPGELLESANAAFARGDYVETRKLCAVIERNGSAEQARDAEALRNRTGVDPAQVAVLALCALFFVIVTWKYVF